MLWSYLTQYTFVLLGRHCAHFSLSGVYILLIQLIIFEMTTTYKPIDAFIAGQ